MAWAAELIGDRLGARMIEFYELLGNMRQSYVQVLRQPRQHVERRRRVDIETFHDNALGLADDVAAFKSTAKLLVLPGHRLRIVPVRTHGGGQGREHVELLGGTERCTACDVLR